MRPEFIPAMKRGRDVSRQRKTLAPSCTESTTTIHGDRPTNYVQPFKRPFVDARFNSDPDIGIPRRPGTLGPVERSLGRLIIAPRLARHAGRHVDGLNHHPVKKARRGDLDGV